MKRILLCCLVISFFTTKMFAIELIGSINTSNGDITVSNKYIGSFWSNPNISHYSTSNYVEKYNTKIKASGGYYLLRLARPTEKAYSELQEDINTFGDVFYNKLDIEYYKDNGTKVSSNTFFNDAFWFKYNYWSFATYTNNPWYETKDITAYVVNLTSDIKAVVLRGDRDSIDPPLLSVFMLFQGKVKLVFNKRVEINSVTSDSSRTLFEVQELKYDSNGNIIPQIYRIVFENGWICVV